MQPATLQTCLGRDKKRPNHCICAPGQHCIKQNQKKKKSSYPKEVIVATQGGQKQLGKEEEIRKHSNQIISHQTTVKCLGGKLPKMNFNEIFKGVDAY